jgi:biotin carboxyl carrier protein
MPRSSAPPGPGSGNKNKGHHADALKGQLFVASAGEDRRDMVLEARGEGRYAVTMDGKRHEVDARRFEGGTWNLIIDGQSYDVELEVASPHESDGQYNVLVRGSVIRLRVQDERHIRMGLGSGRLEVDGPQIVTSPMPGKIVKVLVAQDEQVGPGQALVLIEAMKMENEIRAPSAGKVSRVFVEAGQAVEAHAKLVSLE